MTSKTNKLRAVFLTALMIGSVFAAGIAFTGGAAAATNPNLTATSQDVGDTGVTLETTADVEGNDDTDYANVTSTDFDLSNVADGDVNVTINGVDRNSSTGGFSVDASEDSLDITLGSTISSSDFGNGDEANITIRNVDNPDSSAFATINAELQTTTPGDSWDSWSASTEIGDYGSDVTINQGPVEFYSHNNSSNYVEVVSEDTTLANLNSGDFNVFNRTDGAVSASVNDTLSDGNRLVLDVDQDLAGDAQLELFGENHTITTTASTVEYGDGLNESAYVGEGVAIVDLGNASSTVDILDTDDNRVATRGLGTDSFVRVFDTDDLNAGETYSFVFGENDEQTEYLELNDLGLTAEVEEDSVEPGDTATVTAQTSDIEQLIEAYFIDSNGDQVGTADAEVSSADDGVAELTPTAPSEEGDYTIVTEHVDTGVSVENSLTVEEVSGDATFDESQPELTQGDVVEIPITLTGTTQASVTLGGDDVNYVANINVTDGNGDGEVVLQWNTYTAGQDDRAFSVADTPDGEDSDTYDVESETDLSGLIADGNYDMEVTTGHGNHGEDATDLGTVYVNPRSADDTGPQSIWTAPGTLDLDEVLDSEDITEDDSIAALYEDRPDDGDYVIHEIEAAGVYGLLANETDGLESAIDDGDLNLTVEETEASTGPNQDPAALNVSAAIDNETVALQADADNSTIYVAVDVDAAEADGDFERDGEVVSLEDGDAYNATFTIPADSSLVAGDDAETASAEYTVVDATTEINYDGDLVTVENAAGQEITGESTLTSGTTFTVRVQSTSTPGEGFIRQDQDVVVQNDGSWTAELDFNGTAADSEFSVNVRHSGTSVAEASGEVVEEGEEPTDTTEGPTDTTEGPTDTTEGPTDTTEAPMNTTEAPTDTTEAPADTTEEDESGGGIPGFGMGIALIAIIGAALLALRDN